MTVANGERSDRRNRGDVVRAAGRLFAEQGFHGTSMRTLGEELGLLGSSLYAHVGSKGELLEEIVSDGVHRCLALAASVADGGAGPTDQLRFLINGHVTLVVDHLDTWTTFVNEYRFLPEEQRARVVVLRDSYQAEFRRIIERGVAAGDFRAGLDVHLVATHILSILNAVARWYRVDGAKTASEVAISIFELVIGGISRKVVT